MSYPLIHTYSQRKKEAKKERAATTTNSILF